MRMGVDTYSFHRLLGQLRRGEGAAPHRLTDGGVAAIEQARALGSQVIGVQTCFLELTELSDSELLSAADGAELVLAWGHPEGLAFGTSAEAETDLIAWLEFAEDLGTDLVRIVVGGPALRGADPVEAQIARTIDPLRRIATRAAQHGLALAVENHGDLTTGELADLLTMTDQPNVGLCLDTANVVRLGEDPVRASAQIAEWTWMVHLKDIESPSKAVDRVAGPCSVRYGTGVVPLEEVLDALSAPIASGAPILLEIGQVRPGDDELELLAAGMDWLRAHSPRAA